MYEPTADGKLELIAVEYITLKGPASLKGHLFSFTNSPNRYGLPPLLLTAQSGLGRRTPMGAFADMNMDVSCEAVKDDGRSSPLPPACRIGMGMVERALARLG